MLLTGANGQLGNDLLRVFQAAGDDVLPFTHTQLDVCSEERVSEVIPQAKPDVVLNTAAFHKVEECEKKAFFGLPGEWHRCHESGAGMPTIRCCPGGLQHGLCFRWEEECSI